MGEFIDMMYPLSLQWHVTLKCQNKCKHCYMSEPSTYKRERERTLSLSEKLDVMKSFDDFGRKYGFSFNDVFILGGDPLLEKDCFDFIESLIKMNKRVSMGGNPETLTDYNCKRLSDLGVKDFQLSLDGLESTHDKIRRPGSFRSTVEAYEKLEHFGIKGTTMATITPLNISEFFDLIDFVFFHTKSKRFSFEFVSCVGDAKGFDVKLTPEEALTISRRYLKIKRDYSMLRKDFSFAEKPGIMRLIHMENGEISTYDNGDTNFIEGCLIGNKCIPILSDGTILSCRRVPEILGRVPEDKIEDILLSNVPLKKYRRPQFWNDCGNCIGWNWCRGCPSISYGESNNQFLKPSFCYAHLLNLDTKVEHIPVSMDTTKEEEAELIKSNLNYQYYNKLMSRSLNSSVTDIIEKISKDLNKNKYFLKNSEQYFNDNFNELNSQDKKLISYRLSNLF